jgi:hypothetical protein
MADIIMMYALTSGVFAVLTGLLFGSRAKRHSVEKKVEGKTGAPV